MAKKSIEEKKRSYYTKSHNWFVDKKVQQTIYKYISS